MQLERKYFLDPSIGQDRPYPSVSIVIPCYNAEKWICQTIDSCLQQAGVEVQIIVLDDGSTDTSLELIKSYGKKVLWETGPNKGVNTVRNRGLELAAGSYTRFLDADDKLEKDVIAKEVALLEKTGADFCYGDWRHLIHLPSTKGEKLLAVEKSGPQTDLLFALLNRWWCPPFVYLYKTEFLRKHRLNWNTQLGFPDDFEFILKVVLEGAAACYLPSLVGYYRQHPGVRLSKIGILAMTHNTLQILDLAERELTAVKRWKPPYTTACCNYYVYLAKNTFGLDRNIFRQLIRKIKSTDADYRPPKKFYAFLVGLFDYERVETVLEIRRRFRRKFPRITKFSDGLRGGWRRFTRVEA